ncbi:hypothetical protein Angca_005911, partial [Angiostrongylus cantonensis]
DLRICTGKNACCTKSIEDEILQSAEKIFKAQLEDKLIVLRHMINSDLNSFRSTQNLARMWDCSLCSGVKESRPCPSLCLNVMKGCLADWAEIDQQWNAVVDSMLKISSKLRGAQNLHHALQPLPVQFSEAVMEMQERGITVSNKVISPILK